MDWYPCTECGKSHPFKVTAVHPCPNSLRVNRPARSETLNVVHGPSSTQSTGTREAKAGSSKLPPKKRAAAGRSLLDDIESLFKGLKRKKSAPLTLAVSAAIAKRLSEPANKAELERRFPGCKIEVVKARSSAVEQPTLNRQVVGSSPAAPATRKGRPRLEDQAKTIKAQAPWLKCKPPMSRTTWYRRKAEKRNRK